MHIVFLTNEYPKKDTAHGGIGTFVKFLAQKLTEKEIKISILGINNLYIDEFTVENNISIYRLKKSKWMFGKFLDYSRRIQNKVKQINLNNNIDIIEGSELNFAFFPKTTTYKKVIRLHGGHHFFANELGKKTKLWKSFQEIKSFKKANNFIAVSNYVGIKTQKYLNTKFTFSTIYNSIDTEKFKPSKNNSINRNEILFVGTVCEKKGIKNLIKAIPIIETKIPNVKLKIVGRDLILENGKSYKSYLKTIIPKVYFKNIEFLNSVNHDKLPEIIDSAEICVYPSLMESFGLTVVEALSMGKPTVVSDIPPFKEIVSKNDIALTFNSVSIQDLAQKIIDLLENKELINLLKNKSRNHVLENFDQNKILNQNIKFYKSLLK